MIFFCTFKNKDKRFCFLGVLFFVFFYIFIGNSVYAAVPTVSSIALENPGETQIPVFNVNVSFSEEVSNVDIVDFRFVESNTDTKKGHIVKVVEYDSAFATETVDSSTINSITTLTGQYFKVTVAANSNLLSTDTNSFEVLVDSTTPITSTSTTDVYITTTDILAVLVDSTVGVTPTLAFDGTSINSGSTIYTSQDKISVTASSLEAGSTLHVTKGYYSSGRIGSNLANIIRPTHNTIRFAGNTQNQNVYGTGNQDSYIKLGASLGHSGIRSIAFWADPDDDIQLSSQRIFNLAIAKAGSTQYDNSIYRDGDTNGIVFSKRGANDADKRTFKYSASGYSYFDKHHYVFVYSSNGWKLYIDGVYVNPTTGSRPSGVPASGRDYNHSFFGKLGHSANYYTGDLQNIIISKKVFGSTEATALYNGGVVLNNVPEAVLDDKLWYAAGINTTPTTLVEDINITDASHNTADFDLNSNDNTNIFVTQIDAQGNESDPARIVVIHDNVNPSTPTISFTSSNIPGDNTITVSDAENNATVTVTATHSTETDTNGDSLEVTNTRTGNGSVTLSLTTLGAWNITAYQTDLAKNDSEISIAATLSIEILAPTLIVNPSYPTENIIISVSDAIQAATVTVTATSFDGTVVIRTRVGNGDLALPLSFGVWTLKVNQTMNSVNSPDSKEYSVLIDANPPTVVALGLDTTGTKSAEFDVKVVFNEEVKNVDIADFVLQDSSGNVKGKITKVTAYTDETFDTESGVFTFGTQPISGIIFKVSVLPDKNKSNQTLIFKILSDSRDASNTNTSTIQYAIVDLVHQVIDYTLGIYRLNVTVDTTVPVPPTLTFGGVTYVSGDTIYTKESQISLNVSSLSSDAQSINIGTTHFLPSNRIEGTLSDVSNPDDTTFRFDGSSSYIGFPAYNFGLFQASQNGSTLRSVSFWADPDDNIGTHNQRIINLANGSGSSTNLDISIHRNGGTKGITLELERYNNDASLTNYIANYTSDNFSYFDRNHYVIIFSGSGWKLYVNGVEAVLSNTPTVIPTTSIYNYNFIGRYSTPNANTDDHYYGGDIQNIIFSSRYFDQDDVADLYNGGYTRDNIPTNVSGSSLIYAGAIGLLLEDAPTVTYDASVSNAGIVTDDGRTTGAQDSGLFNINTDTTNHIFVTQTNALGITSKPIYLEVINSTQALSKVNIVSSSSSTSIGDHTITISNAETDAIVTVTATHSSESDTNGDPLKVTGTRTGNGDVTLALLKSGQWVVIAVQTDLFGNKSSQTVLTINLDTDAPIISVTTLANTNISDTNDVVTTTTGFVTGEIITITATPTDTTKSTVTGTINTSTTSRSVTLTLDDGEWTISAIQSIGTGSSESSASHVIVVDTIAPTFSITVPATTPATSKEITITPIGTDVTVVTYSSFLTTWSDSTTCAASADTLFVNTATGNTFTLGDEADNGKYICVRAVDEAGNTAKQISTSTIGGIDVTAPVFTIAIAPETTVLSQSKTVTLTNTNNESSVAYSYFLTTWSDNTTCTASADTLFVNTLTGNTFTLDEETQNDNYICVRAVDGAGNITKQVSIKIENIDTTAPAFTIDIAPATSVVSQFKTVTLTNTNNEFLVAYSYFLTTWSDSTTCTASADTLFVNTLTGNTFTLGDEADNGKYICVRAVDEAGNITKQISTDEIENIDTTAPTFSITVPATTPATTKEITITPTGTDQTTYTYSYFLITDNTACTTSDDNLFINTITNLTFTLTAESDNDKYICVRATDAAGNITKQVSIKIEGIDTTAPAFTIDIAPATSVASQSKTVTLTNTNNESSVSYSHFLIADEADCSTQADSLFVNTGNTFTLDNETQNDKYLCVRAEDAAGNITKQVSIKIENIDTTSPTITNTKKDSDYQITIYVSEAMQTVTSTSVSSGGGFTFTNNDGTTTLTPTTISIANDQIILGFDTSGTALTSGGTYTYVKQNPSLIKDLAGNDLESFGNTNVENFSSFNLDLDSSGDYTASKDGLFLYLYTQTAYTLNDTALSQLIDSNSSLVDTKAKINDGINSNSLDLDSSGDYTASKDGLFLYLYTQTAYTLNDTALSQLIDSNSSLQGTKDNIQKLIL